MGPALSGQGLAGAVSLRQVEEFDLSGHVGVVTGGNRGIGLGLARGLARAGAAVAIWSRDQERNRAAAAELEGVGAEAAAFACDVSVPADVEEALTATLERFGRVDSLFANAGTTGVGFLPDLDEEEWRRVLDVNLTGAYLCARAAAGHMIERGEGGSLVFTASLAAHFGIPQSPHYTATKGGLLALARSLAVGLARYRIRVNVLSPGWIDTEMTEAVQAHEKLSSLFMARTPARRWGNPSDFEAAAVFLAGPGSAFMTGSELTVDGGFSAS